MKYFVHQQKYVFFWKVSKSKMRRQKEAKGRKRKGKLGKEMMGKRKNQQK